MGIDGLSNFQPEGGLMEEVPKDEMTAEELARQGYNPPDDAQATEADQVQRGHEASQEDDDGNGDEPAPVDDPNLPEDGDPEVEGLQSEPIRPEDFQDPEPETSDTGEVREDPADLSGIKKEFDD